MTMRVSSKDLTSEAALSAAKVWIHDFSLIPGEKQTDGYFKIFDPGFHKLRHLPILVRNSALSHSFLPETADIRCSAPSCSPSTVVWESTRLLGGEPLHL